MENISRILNTPLNNLTINDFKIIGEFLNDDNNISIIENEFTEQLHYLLLDFYHDFFSSIKQNV